MTTRTHDNSDNTSIEETFVTIAELVAATLLRKPRNTHAVGPPLYLSHLKVGKPAASKTDGPKILKIPPHYRASIIRMDSPLF